jgi:hypothetical protein
MASRASATPPPDWTIHEPWRFFETAQTVILVRVVNSNPVTDSAGVKVLKSWKGPFSAGRVLHVEPPAICAGGSCKPYVFQAGDKELLIVVFDAKDREPIGAWDGWVWPAAESQPLIEALDKAVARAS